MLGLADHQVPIFQEAVEKSFQKPEWFFKNILKFPVLPWQHRAIHAVFDVRRKAMGIPTVVNHEGLPRISIRSCHGTGKTQFLALLAHIWNFTTYGKIAATAPKEAQLTRRLFPRYRHAMRSAPAAYKDLITVLGREIKFFDDDDWGMVAETASDPDNLAGYHDQPQLFLIDEASAKRLDPMFPVIEGALTTPGSVAVEIGNPTRVEGEFYNHHNKPGVKELYFTMHIKQSDAPELVSQEWVDNMVAKYGKNSPIALIRAFGEFAAFDDAILIHPEYIDDALDIEEQTDGSHPHLRISVDVADGGQDSTQVTAMRHYESHEQLVKQTGYHHPAHEAILKAADVAENMFYRFKGRKGIDDFVVDANGVGSGTAGILMKRGHKVVAFRGGKTEGVVDTTKYRNWRVQSSIALHQAFFDRTLRITPDAIDDEEDFRAHILAIKRREGSEKVDDIETKEKTVTDAGFSPDKFDSLMMQYADKRPTHLANGNASDVVLIGNMETAGNDW